MSKLKEVHTINEHQKGVFAIIVLHDGRLASCSFDGTIKVLNKSTYKCELTIDEGAIPFPFLSVLNNGNIVASSSEGDIYIYSITKDNFEFVHQISSGHGSKDLYSQWISVVFQISNNRIASGAADNTIKIWNDSEPYNCIATLIGHTDIISSILQLKGQELLVSCARDQTLRIWSLINYQCITVINKVKSYDTGGMMEIKGNRVLVGGESTITVVDIGKLRIEKTISEPFLDYIYSACYLDNDKYIFGNYNGDFIIYNEASNTIERKIDKVHSKCISFILRINDKMISSCSEDNSIKIWSID